MCPPVAVPAQPRIPAGRRFLRGPPIRVPQQGPPPGWRAFSSKPVKWTIGRFYWLTRRTRSFLQLWRHGSDFLYTKNSAMGRSDCIYTKNSARPSWGAMRQKMAIFKGGNSVSSTPRQFQCYEQLGAMRQKMTIFKKRNNVCRVQMFFRSSHFIFLIPKRCTWNVGWLVILR